MDLDVIKQRRPFPNLALMKLSAYHKAQGDEVFLNFPLRQADITYASCVFTWHAERRCEVPADAIIGGSGIDLTAKLPLEVEHMKPDYSLYPNPSPLVKNSSIGYTSRGCPRKCPWCIVYWKEGGIRAHASIYEFLDRRYKKVVLFDNNLLASPNWRQTMEDLLTEDLEVDINQGLDIRLVNEDTVSYLKRVKVKKLRFSFDNLAQERAVRKGIELLVRNDIRSRRLSFYVLVGFRDDDSAIERMKILHSYNVDVYPMLYKRQDGKEPEPSRKSIRDIYSALDIEGIFWHGSRQNIKKFLRGIGRLPE